ncbi:cytohesin-1-like [Symsagittifera roscoffensis]|uniref:cytohesin-1-like n=1 Tax=Symsagittifera roscoffensis TaxID=84072 RepID=UPI00307B8EA5
MDNITHNEVAIQEQKKFNLRAEMEENRRNYAEIESRLKELQSAVDAQSDSTKLGPAIELFNNGKFVECFSFLIELGTVTDDSNNYEKSQFLREQSPKLNIEKFHKYLFKPENERVLKIFIWSINITGLNLLESVRQCFEALRFTEAEAGVISFIYKCISESYFRQNKEEAEKNFGTEDVCEFAAGAVVFINTSLNNSSVKAKDRMTEDQFANFGQCDEVKQWHQAGIQRDYMVKLYREIKENPLRFNCKRDQDASTGTEAKVIKSGFLEKQGGERKSWTKRYFVLHSDILYYYTDDTATSPKGIIILQNLEVSKVDLSKKKFCFQLASVDGSIITASKANSNGPQVPAMHSRYIMNAASEELRDSWVSAIHSTLKMDMMHAFQSWRQQDDERDGHNRGRYGRRKSTDSAISIHARPRTPVGPRKRKGSLSLIRKPTCNIEM